MNFMVSLQLYTTWAVVKLKPEKRNSSLNGIGTHDLCTGIAEVMGLNPV